MDSGRRKRDERDHFEYTVIFQLNRLMMEELIFLFFREARYKVVGFVSTGIPGTWLVAIDDCRLARSSTLITLSHFIYSIDWIRFITIQSTRRNGTSMSGTPIYQSVNIFLISRCVFYFFKYYYSIPTWHDGEKNLKNWYLIRCYVDQDGFDHYRQFFFPAPDLDLVDCHLFFFEIQRGQ